jgi:hypothetical protein
MDAMIMPQPISVSGHRFSGANPVAEIKPAASAKSFAWRITMSALSPRTVTGATLLLVRYQAGMYILLALSVAVITPAQSTAIRCVAALGIVANRQKHGEGWADYPDLNLDGSDFATLVGEDVVRTTGKTQEQVRDLILGEVVNLEKQKEVDRGEIDRCLVLMRAQLAPTTVSP